MRVVTAYTPDYSLLASRLVNSCVQFNERITAIPFADRGSWQANCNSKPEHILRVMQETGDDVLWLDADMYLTAPLPEFAKPADCWLKRTVQDRVFDFTQRKIVPNDHMLAVPWGGHCAFAWTEDRHGWCLVEYWNRVCKQWTPATNDEQCLLFALDHHHIDWPATIAPFPDPAPWLRHTPAGTQHGKPQEWSTL